MSKVMNRVELNLHDALNYCFSLLKLRKTGEKFNIPYIVDRPGAGKTMMSHQFAEDNNCNILAYSPGLERLEKFGGIPDVYFDNEEDKKNKKNLRTIWSVPQMIWEINDTAANGKPTLVLLDDWHLCTEDLQQIGFELFTYYSLNGAKVQNAENVLFVLAGNETSAAGAKIQLSAIRNRCTIIYTKPDPEYWINSFAIPNGVHPMGISFFQNPENIGYFQEEESVSDQFGSPRSWSSALTLIKHLELGGGNRHMIQSILQGSVSLQATQKFMLHYDVFSKIDIDKIFNTGKVDISNDPVDRFCMSAAMNEEFYKRYLQFKADPKGKKDPSEIYVKYITELVEKKYQEIACLTLSNFKNYGTRSKSKYDGLGIVSELIEKDLLPKSLQKTLVEVFKVIR